MPGRPAADWHRDRVDQHAGPRDGAPYSPAATGRGVHVYVIDSGITPDHEEFTGRLSGTGFTAVQDGLGTGDCYSHGTHVASSAAGTRYGIATDATIHAVRVYDCQGEGSDSGHLDALNWVVANAEMPAVVNASWGGGGYPALAQAVAKVIDAGIPMASAAGNADNDACGMYPASYPGVMTVAASGADDTLSSYSGHGSCVDIVAPGTNITGAKMQTKNEYMLKSGTSMATPMVAGAMALYLQQHPKATPAQVNEALVDSSTKDALTGLDDGTPNRLLYVGKN